MVSLFKRKFTKEIFLMEGILFIFNVMIAFAVGGVIYHFIERMFDND